ncbi:MAG: tRNA-dihydrouridine synthase [Candidatus Roizmanbacteria bacterium]
MADQAIKLVSERPVNRSHPDQTFWQILPKPIIGLAPMDGVTDAAFRQIVDIHGHPSVLFTEFVPVEAIKASAPRVLDAFVKHDTDTPTIAQVYGTDLDAYYQTTFIVCDLGFDGVDINMGCPAKSVTSRGAGAGLIRQPAHATQIIRTVKQAIGDWSQGKTYEQPKPIKEKMDAIRTSRPIVRRHIPVSIKTRIGYDVPVTKEWVSTLAAEGIDSLTIHGRTFKQLYSGKAVWEEIALAAETARSISPQTTVLGNGDLMSLDQARDYVQKYHLDGALIGRASWGNPWVFTNSIPTPQQKLMTALEHAHLLRSLLPEAHILSLRKHMAWYCTGFPQAATVRSRLLTIKSIEDIESIIADCLHEL